MFFEKNSKKKRMTQNILIMKFEDVSQTRDPNPNCCPLSAQTWTKQGEKSPKIESEKVRLTKLY